MPSRSARDRAKQRARKGEAPTTQAGEFVREEIEHVRKGKHGARSPEQVIAIGLSKARRAGVTLPPPKKGAAPEGTRRSAELAYEEGQGRRRPRAPSPKRSRAALRPLEREGRGAASREALSRETRKAAAKRTPADRSAAARRGAASRTPAERSAAAKRAAATRRRARGASPARS